MATDVIGRALVKIDPDFAGFSSKVTRESETAGSKSGKRFGSLFRKGLGSMNLLNLASIGSALRLMEGLGRVLEQSVTRYEEVSRATRVTNDLLLNNGHAAHESSKAIDQLTNSLSMKTGTDALVVRGSENVLLSFAKVQDQAGKGHDIFKRAASDALDVSTVYHKSLIPVSIALGKALDNPIRGMTGLSRAGVVLTTDQRDVIKKLTESGHQLQAQAMLLDIVEQRTKGAAAAAVDPMKQLAVVTQNLKTALGAGLVGGLSELAKAFVSAEPVIAPMVRTLGVGLGGVVTALIPVLKSITPVLAAIVPPIVSVLKLVGDAFARTFSAIGPMIVPFFSALSQILGPVVNVLGQLAASVLPPLASVFLLVVKAATPFIAFLTGIANVVLNALQPVLVSLMPMFTTLGRVFADTFGVLFRDGGALSSVIDQLAATFRGLTPIIMQVVGLFGTALGGSIRALAPVVGMMMRLFGELVKTILPPLVQIWAAVERAMLPLLPVFAKLVAFVAGQFIGVLQTLLSSFKPLIPIIVQLVTLFAGVLSSTLRAIVPLLTPIVHIFAVALSGAIRQMLPVVGQLLKSLMPLLPVIGQLAVTIVGALAPVFGKLIAVIVPLVSRLLPPMVKLIESLAPIMVQLAPVIGQVVTVLGGGLVKVISALAPALPSVVDAIMSMSMAMYQLLPVVLKLLPPFLKFFTFLIQHVSVPLLLALAHAVADIAQWFADAVNAVSKFIGAIGSLDLGKIATSIGHFFTALPGEVGRWLGDIGSTVWNWIKSAFDAVTTNGPRILASVGRWFAGLPGKLIRFAGDLAGAVLKWVGHAFMWVAKKGPGLVITMSIFWITLPLRIVKWIGDLGAKLVTWIARGFIAVVKALPKIISATITFFQKLPGRLINAAVHFASLLNKWAKSAFDGLSRALGSIASGLYHFFSRLPGELIRKAAGIGREMLKLGHHVIDSIFSGITTGAKAFWKWFKDIPSKIMSFMKDISKGLFKFGSTLIDSIIKGVESAPGKLVKAISKLIPGSGVLGSAKKLLGLAKGGIFTQATAAVVGESGPEVVVPLTDPQRAADLVRASGLLTVLGIATTPGDTSVTSLPATAVASAAPSAAPGPVAPPSVAVQPPTVPAANFTSIAPQAIDALKGFGQTVWKGVAPTFDYLHTQIRGSFDKQHSDIVAWPTKTLTDTSPNLAALNAGVSKSFDSLATGVQGQMSAFSGSTLGQFKTMGDGANASVVATSTAASGHWRSMFGTLNSEGKSGGDRVVSSVKGSLGAGTKAVTDVVRGYSKSMGNALNPLLSAIGQPKIDISKFARGGINDPRIVSDGSYDVHVFGERGTKGEAYIPFNPALKNRSRAIAEETVARLGGRADWFAQGGITGDITPAQISAVQAFGNAQVGKPYVWGAVGPGSYDCSGLVSAMMNTLRGSAPFHRLFTTATLRSVAGGLGLIPGLGQVSIGNSPANHMAMTVGGTNYEATPPAVRSGPGARGADNPYFPDKWHVGSGVFMPGGAGGVNLPAIPNIGHGVLGTTAKAAISGVAKTAADWVNQHVFAPTSITGGGDSGFVPPTGTIGHILATIRAMESNNNYTARNSVSSASGAYQFVDGTWANFGGFPHAYLAPPAIQDQRATQDVMADLARYNNDLESVPAAWYTGTFRGRGNLNYRPNGPGNPLTVQQYVDRWLAKYQSIQGFARGGMSFMDGLYRLSEGNTPEVILPTNDPLRALDVARDSGMLATLDQARSKAAAPRHGAPPARTRFEGQSPDGGILGGGPGNTYIIHGIGWDQVMAEIKARDEVVDNVRR